MNKVSFCARVHLRKHDFRKLIKNGIIKQPADYLVNIPCDGFSRYKIDRGKDNCLPFDNIFNKIIILYKKILIK